MLVAQHCHVGVVVEVQQLAPPEQRHGEAVLEHHGRRRAQADGPVPERPERCPAPVEGPDPPRHLAAHRQHARHVDPVRAPPVGVRVAIAVTTAAGGAWRTHVRSQCDAARRRG